MSATEDIIRNYHREDIARAFLRILNIDDTQTQDVVALLSQVCSGALSDEWEDEATQQLEALESGLYYLARSWNCETDLAAS